MGSDKFCSFLEITALRFKVSEMTDMLTHQVILVASNNGTDAAICKVHSLSLEVLNLLTIFI